MNARPRDWGKFYDSPVVKQFGALSFYLGCVFCCYPGLFLNFSGGLIRGDMGDLHNILGIISFSTGCSLDNLFHLPVFYPIAYVMAKTHPLFGISLLYKVFMFLGLSLTESTNLYIILSLTFGAWGTFLLAREFIGGKWIFFPLLLSTLYILHPMNHLHFVWLNFLSRFYLPFVLLFLVRYVKEDQKRGGRNKDAVAAVVLSFFQFLSCMYYGVLLWAVLIPFFLVTALVLKQLTFSRLRFALMCFFLGGLLILLIYYPYLTHNPGMAKHFDGKLVDAQEIFSVSRVFSSFLGPPPDVKQYLFPGFVFTLLFLLYFVSPLSRGRTGAAGSLGITVLVLCFLVYRHRLMLNVLFMVFCGFLVYLAIKRWKDMAPFERVFLVTGVFMALFLFHFTAPGFLRGLSLYRVFYFLLPVGGLTVIKRAALWLLPVFIVLASVGASRWFGEKLPRSNAKRILIFSGLLLLMALENLRPPLLYMPGDNGVMKPLPAKPAVYDALPYEGNKVVLELPFYLRRRLKNTLYMINRRFHRNPTLNGKITLFPAEYYRGLSDILGKFMGKFPSLEGFKRLHSDYFVSYIVIHWELFKHYREPRRGPVNREEILKSIGGMSRYVEVISDTPGYTLLRLRDGDMSREKAYTFSYYHLKHYSLRVVLSEIYKGRVGVSVNGEAVKTVPMHGRKVELDLSGASLSDKGNVVTFSFESPVLFSSIDMQ